MKELVTESVAANFYAVAWNKLDVGIIKELLHEEVEYVLKKNNQSLKGRKDLLAYLQRNMNRIKKAPIQYEIFAEIAETFDDKQCVLLAQGEVDKIKNAVFFTVEKGKITKIIVDKYDPNVVVWRTGNYPGTEEQLSDNEYIENKPKLTSNYDEDDVTINKTNLDENEPEVDINEIKEKFLQSNPKYAKQKTYKNPIVAALLGFFFPGLGLFYISIRQGLYNLGAVVLLDAIFFSSILRNVFSQAANPNLMTQPYHHTGMGTITLLFFVSFIISVGSGLWGYLAAKYHNES